MDRIQPSISSEDYDSFAVILKDAPEFPASYLLWCEQCLKENEKEIARGKTLNKVQVHPQEFAEYCRACGQNASLTMLGAFAVAKNHRNA